MPDANGAVNSVFRTNATTPYLNIKIVASDIPPTATKTPVDANGALSIAYDSATGALKVVAV
jgi:hypothetical protein